MFPFPFWPLYLIGAMLVCIRNPQAGIAFALHLLAMQCVKLLDYPDIQVRFFAVHTASAVLVALFLDKIAGAVLAAIALIYLGHIAGFVGQGIKIFLAEGLFILGLVGSAANGPTGAFLVSDNTPDASGYPDAPAGGAVHQKVASDPTPSDRDDPAQGG